MTYRTAACAVFISAGSAGMSSAQLVTAYTGDESGAKNWIINVETGSDIEGPLGKSRALAADPATNRIFEIEPIPLGSNTVQLRTSRADAGGVIESLSRIGLSDSAGNRIRIMTSLAFGDGVLYGYASGSGGAVAGLGTIDTATGRHTLVPANDLLPVPEDGLVLGLAYDNDRGRLLVGVREGPPVGSTNAVYAFDPDTGSAELVLTGAARFDGLAYGRGRVWMDCGAPCGPIQVFNTLTQQFEPTLPLPARFGNGSGGATFLEALGPNPAEPCPADTNGDNQLTPADFNAWVIAFNTNDDACDQNSDGLCTPADFNVWVLNFNAGCP
ncbi:MAG: GC-type dockerin domain-anchored protein [Planctomycetota bacterium]